jgi:hypothetical protein
MKALSAFDNFLIKIVSYILLKACQWNALLLLISMFEPLLFLAACHDMVR